MYYMCWHYLLNSALFLPLQKVKAHFCVAAAATISAAETRTAGIYQQQRGKKKSSNHIASRARDHEEDIKTQHALLTVTKTHTHAHILVYILMYTDMAMADIGGR